MFTLILLNGKCVLYFSQSLKEKNENQISMQYFQTFLESLVQVPKQERLIKNEGAEIQIKAKLNFYDSQLPLLGYECSTTHFST